MKEKDEWAIVLDFLPHGHPGQTKPEPVAQVVGERFFSLLDIVPRDGVTLALGDRVYIGDGPRDKVKYIKRALKESELTTTARAELEEVVKDVVREAEERFVEFFNRAEPLTIRMHTLELLPGMGKKHTWELLEARKERPFSSYDDIKQRCPTIPDPRKMLEKRIMKEVRGEDPHHTIFVKLHGLHDE